MKSDRPAGHRRDTRSTLSRRAFLAVSGGVAGTTIVGQAGADEGTAVEALDVAATAPYRDTVRRSLEDVGGRVSTESAFGDGATILVAGRSVDATGTLGAVAADASAVLANSDGEWREPLPRRSIREQWAGDAPVETWSESPGAPERASSEDVNDGATAADGPILVRGPRAYQYADGQGGVGYYDIRPDAVLTGESTGGDATSLVRVAYVHVDEDAVDDATAAAFVERYRDRVGTVADVTTQFLDPIVEG